MKKTFNFWLWLMFNYIRFYLNFFIYKVNRIKWKGLDRDEINFEIHMGVWDIDKNKMPIYNEQFIKIDVVLFHYCLFIFLELRKKTKRTENEVRWWETWHRLCLFVNVLQTMTTYWARLCIWAFDLKMGHPLNS